MVARITLRDIMGENGMKYRHVVFRIDSLTVMLGGLFNGAASNVAITQS